MVPKKTLPFKIRFEQLGNNLSTKKLNWLDWRRYQDGKHTKAQHTTPNIWGKPNVGKT